MSEQPHNPDLTRHDDGRFYVTSEQARSYWREAKLDIGGKTVEFYGVVHHPVTLEIPEFREKLESAIRRSSVVLLEWPPAQLELSVEEFLAIAHDMNAHASEEELRTEFEIKVQGNPFIQFFHELASVAAKEGKDVAHADPIRGATSGLSLELAELKSDAIKMALFLSSMGIVVTSEMIQRIVGVPHDVRRRVNRAEEGGMTRRSFLKKAAVVSAGIGAMTGASIAAGLNELYGDADRDENKFGLFLQSMMDYRDCSVADAMVKLSGELKEDETMAVVYGAAHLPGISHYLDHPTERAAKLLSYVPIFGRASRSKPSRYTYRDGKWILRKE